MSKKSYIFTMLIVLSNLLFSQKLTVSSINSNSAQDDFAPMFYKDGIILVSNRKNSLFENYYELDKKGNEIYLNDIYQYSFTKDNNKLKQEHELDALNEAFLHDGPCTFTAQYDTAYFSRSSFVKKRNEKSTIGIYQSINTKNGWTNPTPLNINSTKYNLSHPFWDFRSKSLYYVSDKENGLGKMDIWKSIKLSDNTWSEPINIGAPINSKDDDIFPYINKYGTIYFASNRKESLGGFDIFYQETTLSNEILQFKTPINSTSDDYSFISNDNAKSGYFTSNRKNKQDDIYFFDHQINSDTCIESYEPKFCFTFYDTEAHRNGKHIKYVWNFGDDSVSHSAQPTHCYTTTGYKNITMDLIDTITGVDSKSVGVFELLIKDPLENYIKTSSKLDSSINLNVTNHSTQKVINENILWKKDDTYIVNKESITLKSTYPSEYQIITFIENNKCLVNRFNIGNYQMLTNKIKIVPNYLKNKVLSIFVVEMLHEYLKQNDAKSIILSIPENVYNQQNLWIDDLNQLMKNEFDLTLSIKIENNSYDTFLILP